MEHTLCQTNGFQGYNKHEFPALFNELELDSETLLYSHLTQIEELIDTNSTIGSRTYILFNSLSWDRREIVEIPLFINSSGIKSISVYDIDQNKKIPIQIDFIENYSSDNSIKNASIYLDAEIPSLGWNCYSMVFNTSYENPLPVDFTPPNV
ncbi:MAG: hypothetical protein GF329_09175 [Candidatus Lokiarchaeota archaeon]|nr:hypothetical protein [Candidatus Lokiarchaeota archaeon]